jgi:hypothetical protein
VDSFEAMTNTDGKKQPGTDQGNAIENETREFRAPGGESDNEPVVTEEDSKLAEEYPDGGDPCGTKH